MRRESLWDSAGGLTRGYDLTGRLTSERQEHFDTLSAAPSGAVVFDRTVTTGYDASGLPQTLNDSIGTVTTNDNYRGQLATLDVDGPPPAFTFNYDAVGRLTGHTNELGVVESRTYDAAGQLTSIGYSNGSTAFDSSGYTLNSAGLRTSLTRAHVGGSMTSLPSKRTGNTITMRWATAPAA